jgi:hypothetical protein
MGLLQQLVERLAQISAPTYSNVCLSGRRARENPLTQFNVGSHLSDYSGENAVKPASDFISPNRFCCATSRLRFNSRR